MVSARRARIDLDEIVEAASEPVARLPLLIKGRLVTAPPLSMSDAAAAANGADAVVTIGDAYVSRRRVAGEPRLVVLPRPSPRGLVESDVGELVRTLYNLPTREVFDYVGALREVVRSNRKLLDDLVGSARGVSSAADFALDVFVAGLPDLLDPHGLADAVDRDLGDASAAGREYLDGWIPVRTPARAGPSARLADRLFGSGHPLSAATAQPFVRAMPTRQLHITSGTSPVIPFISALRAFGTKSASVIKSPAETTVAATILAVAMSEVDPDHPLTRHTSLVWWPGGDETIEGPLFARDAFDRVVVWGSQPTIESVQARARSTRTVVLAPRVGVSLIGRDRLGPHLPEVVARAASDSMILEQHACMSSVVHYVEGSEDEALAYCEVLRDVLARWDNAFPAPADRDRTAALRYLRRGHFIDGRWFENAARPTTGSVVVYLPHGFDLSVHPLSRVVVVRRVGRLVDALRHLGSAVSTVGVYPESQRRELRDELAALGIAHVVPLGAAERTFAGMPHDGMRILSELVSWVSA